MYYLIWAYAITIYVAEFCINYLRRRFPRKINWFPWRTSFRKAVSFLMNSSIVKRLSVAETGKGGNKVSLRSWCCSGKRNTTASSKILSCKFRISRILRFFVLSSCRNLRTGARCLSRTSFLRPFFSRISRCMRFISIDIHRSLASSRNCQGFRRCE